ncbi:unnamed protein product [Effrenium voratum]|nr:unnamed protein product [Effrenium voratum]
MDFWSGLSSDLRWCSQSSAQFVAGDWHFGCLPHVNQSLFCCGDELLELREHAEQVLIYRKRALNDAADQMDSFGGGFGACRLQEYLWLGFAEARVVAVGGLEVLRFAMQDLSCQLCWANDFDRSAQIARVAHRDLEAVMRRLAQLRQGLAELLGPPAPAPAATAAPACPSLPFWWVQVAAPAAGINVSVRAGGLWAVRQWMESLAVSMTAVAGEFQTLAFLLHTGPKEFPLSQHTQEGAVHEVPVPRQQPGRVALFLHECAELSYPKIDIITVGRQECTSLWRKFPYADPATSVMLPDAALRISCEVVPTRAQLAGIATLLLRPEEGSLPETCALSPVLPPFDASSLNQPRPKSKALIFLCLHSTFCGGHGDRLFGMLSAFLAALLTGRAFFIDMRTPLPLSSILLPKEPWPASTSSCVTYRWTSAEDAASLEADIRLFMSDTSEVICVASNLRLFKVLLGYDAQRRFTRTGLVSGLFRHLFGLGGAGFWVEAFRRRVAGRRLLGIHFRGGNESTWSDPARHGLWELDAALSCAASVEAQLGLQNSAWLLAADTMKVRRAPQVARLHELGKVLFLEDRPTHIDRSTPDALGIFQSWAVWWVLAFETDAVLLSHSNFGWSAAEIGQRRAFHFPTCRPADVTSP